MFVRVDGCFYGLAKGIHHPQNLYTWKKFWEKLPNTSKGGISDCMCVVWLYVVFACLCTCGVGGCTPHNASNLSIWLHSLQAVPCTFSPCPSRSMCKPVLPLTHFQPALRQRCGDLSCHVQSVACSTTSTQPWLYPFAGCTMSQTPFSWRAGCRPAPAICGRWQPPSCCWPCRPWLLQGPHPPLQPALQGLLCTTHRRAPECLVQILDELRLKGVSKAAVLG